MIIPRSLARSLVFGDGRNDEYKIIEESSWKHASDKYEEKWVVFSYQDKFYEITNGRSGSPFTDWHYDSDDWGEMVEVLEVEKFELITTSWRYTK